jgi:uncharacterized protein
MSDPDPSLSEPVRSAAPAPFGPTKPAERISAIDVLRGVALFGILAANMRGFFAPEPVYFFPLLWFRDTADVVAQRFVDLLIQGKFITLFAFLFGVGFAMQISRAVDQGRSIRFYPRRLFILFVFGLVHGALIWWGDVLLAYAIGGFMLLLFRNRKQKTVAIWGAALFALPLLAMTGFAIAVALGHGPASGGGFGPPPPQEAAVREAIAAYRGGFVSHALQNMRDWVRANTPIIPIVFVFVFPRFLAGLWVWRSGLLRNLEERAATLRRIWVWSGSLGLAATLATLAIEFGAGITPGKVSVGLLLMQMTVYIAAPALSAFYGSSVLLLTLRDEWKPRLAPFGAVGRMALTNYLMQSLLLTNLFWLAGWYGHVGPALGLIPTFVLYAAQVKFSVWWLERYQFGPAEWLWRSLTYGKKQPMRRVADAPAIQTAVAGA